MIRVSVVIPARDEGARIAATVTADVREFFDSDGKPKRIQDVPEALRLAIKDCEIEPITGRLRSISLKDKADAAEELLRFMGEADKPEVVALLKAVREQLRRTDTIMEAMRTMREDKDPQGLPS